ncbi:hypothetical protein KR222_006987 [Zaprionus bogoriensis]|nr:hypothetical protein KR222_006987 [Zaprionus bogoriensis]
MTLPTNTNAANGGSGSGSDDDSDMFGPPRCSPPIGYHHHRSRVPMISPKLRQREERKRILQLCAHKLERIKDSEANLRRSVCINNTYCRLTDELRREKQLRYVQNMPKTENSSTELARENLFQPNMDDAKPMNNNNSSNKSQYGNAGANDGANVAASGAAAATAAARTICSIENHQLAPLTAQQQRHQSNSNSNPNSNSICNSHSNLNPNCNANSNSMSNSMSNSNSSAPNAVARKRQLSNSNLVNDLEILDRELSAINAPMPLIDPEITQGAEQLEKASLSAARKRLRSSSEDESDRLVREALSQFYIPPQRLISAIEDCPLDVVGLGVGLGAGLGSGLGAGVGVGVGVIGDGSVGVGSNKRCKLNPVVGAAGAEHLELVDFDMNQNQKDFEVIMDALRLGTPSPPSGASSDSCGQAAMMSESASVFHNLVVTSLET